MEPHSQPVVLTWPVRVQLQVMRFPGVLCVATRAYWRARTRTIALRYLISALVLRSAASVKEILSERGGLGARALSICYLWVV